MPCKVDIYANWKSSSFPCVFLFCVGFNQGIKDLRQRDKPDGQTTGSATTFLSLITCGLLSLMSFIRTVSRSSDWRRNGWPQSLARTWVKRKIQYWFLTLCEGSNLKLVFSAI